jgi:hypothetical protein
MTPDDSLNGGQADTVAGKFRGGVEPLKWLKQAVRGSGIKAGSVVAHEINGPSIFDVRSEFDSAVFMPRRVFPRIAENIVHHDAQQTRVSLSLFHVRDHEINFDVSRNPESFTPVVIPDHPHGTLLQLTNISPSSHWRPFLLHEGIND